MTVKELKVDAGGQSDEGQQNPAAISRSPLFYRQSELQGRFLCSIERAVDYEGKVRPRPAKGRMPLALSLTTRRCWLGRGSLRLLVAAGLRWIYLASKWCRVAPPRLSALAGIWTLICVLAGLLNPSRLLKNSVSITLTHTLNQKHKRLSR